MPNFPNNFHFKTRQLIHSQRNFAFFYLTRIEEEIEFHRYAWTLFVRQSFKCKSKQGFFFAKKCFIAFLRSHIEAGSSEFYIYENLNKVYKKYIFFNLCLKLGFHIRAENCYQPEDHVEPLDFRCVPRSFLCFLLGLCLASIWKL